MPDRIIGNPGAGSFHPSSQPPGLDADRATSTGTARYSDRFISRLGEGFYRPLADGVVVSSLGIGTYLGEPTAAEDEAYAGAVREAVNSGINLIDSAINYRCQRSERVIGRVLRATIEAGYLRRDELVVSSKGGFIPLDESAPLTREGYQGYLRREFYAKGVMRPEDVVTGGHSLAPSFLRHQLASSLANLGLHTLDTYYVHCPEQQLGTVSYEDLLERMRAAFATLEERVDAGQVASYGVATWAGLRTPPGRRDHLSLVDLVRIATEVAGEKHHFRVVQLPVSLAMPEALRLPTQPMPDGRLLTVLEAAAELGLRVIASAPLAQGKLAAGMPAQIAELFPGHDTDAQRALAFVRSLPLTAALVGMRRREHVAENLGTRD